VDRNLTAQTYQGLTKARLKEGKELLSASGHCKCHTCVIVYKNILKVFWLYYFLFLSAGFILAQWI